MLYGTGILKLEGFSDISKSLNELNVASLWRELSCYAAFGLFMTLARFYTPRYINFRRNSFTWLVINLPENVIPASQGPPMPPCAFPTAFTQNASGLCSPRTRIWRPRWILLWLPWRRHTALHSPWPKVFSRYAVLSTSGHYHPRLRET